MRIVLRMAFLLLLFSAERSSAERIEQWQRSLAASQALTVFILADTAVDYCQDALHCTAKLGTENLTRLCQIPCAYPLSEVQLAQRLLEAANITWQNITTLENAPATAACEKHVYLTFFAQQAIFAEQYDVLLALQKKGMDLTAITQNSALAWQQKMYFAAAAWPLIAREETDLFERLNHLITSLLLSAKRVTRKEKIPSLTVLGKKTVLALTQPNDGVTWPTQLFEFAVDEKQVRDSEGKALFHDAGQFDGIEQMHEPLAFTVMDVFRQKNDALVLQPDAAPLFPLYGLLDRSLVLYATQTMQFLAPLPSGVMRANAQQAEHLYWQTTEDFRAAQQGGNITLLESSGESLQAFRHVWLNPGHEQRVYRYALDEQNSLMALPSILLASLAFSKPQPLLLRYQQQAQLAMLMGGGYEASLRKNGELAFVEHANTIYLFDAYSAQIIWQARYGAEQYASGAQYFHPQLRYAFAADIAVLRDKHGFVRQAYALDMAGQVWRVYLPNCLAEQCADFLFRQTQWRVQRVANLAAEGEIFMLAPTIARVDKRDWLSLVSSDSEQILRAQHNHWYFLSLPLTQPIEAQNIVSINSCLSVSCSAQSAWKIALAVNEVAIDAPVYFNGAWYLKTVITKTEQCTIQDEYFLHQVRFEHGVPKQWQKQTIAADSIFMALNAQNIIVLDAALTELFIKVHDIPPKDALSHDAALQQNKGLVIHSWQVKTN